MRRSELWIGVGKGKEGNDCEQADKATVKVEESYQTRTLHSGIDMTHIMMLIYDEQLYKVSTKNNSRIAFAGN